MGRVQSNAAHILAGPAFIQRTLTGREGINACVMEILMDSPS